MGENIDRTGEIHTTNSCGDLKIIEWNGWKNATIQFLEDETIVKNILYSSIKGGRVKNPNKISLYGIGYLGQGKHKVMFNKKETKKYRTWSHILERGHWDKTKSKRQDYEDLNVCIEWHCFQNFGDWFDTVYNSNYMEKWHIDKDILIKGNKIYSPETCCLVPHDINVLFSNKTKENKDTPSGVTRRGKKFRAKCSMWKKPVDLGTFSSEIEAAITVKKAKEKYIKEVADVWKPLIDIKVYQAMYNYTVDYENI